MPFGASTDKANRGNDLHLISAGRKLVKVIEPSRIGDCACDFLGLPRIQNHRGVGDQRFVGIQLCVAVFILIDPPLNGDRLGKTGIPHSLRLLPGEGEDSRLPAAGHPQPAGVTIDRVVKPLVTLGWR